jgi:hypothetical protein
MTCKFKVKGTVSCINLVIPPCRFGKNVFQSYYAVLSSMLNHFKLLTFAESYIEAINFSVKVIIAVLPCNQNVLNSHWPKVM